MSFALSCALEQKLPTTTILRYEVLFQRRSNTFLRDSPARRVSFTISVGTYSVPFARESTQTASVTEKTIFRLPTRIWTNPLTISARLTNTVHKQGNRLPSLSID